MIVAQVRRQKFASVPPMSLAERWPHTTEIENKMVVRNAANTSAKLRSRKSRVEGRGRQRGKSNRAFGGGEMSADLVGAQRAPINGHVTKLALEIRKIITASAQINLRRTGGHRRDGAGGEFDDSVQEDARVFAVAHESDMIPPAFRQVGFAREQ